MDIFLSFKSEPEDDNATDWDKLENEEDESILLKAAWERDVRLPRNVLPEHYDLYLFPMLQTNRLFRAMKSSKPSPLELADSLIQS